MTTHVNNLIAKAGQATYALKLVKSHGLPMRSMDIVTQSTLFSPLTYASPAWIGYANKEDLSRLQAPINRAHRWGLCSASLFQALCDKADQTLFQKVTSFTGHILHSMLPPKQNTTYNLRPRRHNYTIPNSSDSLQRNLMFRMLYKTRHIKPTDNSNRQ